MRYQWLMGLMAVATASQAADFKIEVSQPRQHIQHTNEKRNEHV